MKLPNADRAFVDVVKLRDYSLNTEHKEGKHKARVFADALGLKSDDAAWLRQKLLNIAKSEDCRIGKKTDYGQRYVIDFELTREGNAARIRSAWIVRKGGLPSISHVLRDIGTAMPNTPLKLLDVVALLVDKPEERLVAGQVGTVVELLSPDVYEVEFLDSKGHTITVTELKRAELLLLQHEPMMAA